MAVPRYGALPGGGESLGRPVPSLLRRRSDWTGVADSEHGAPAARMAGMTSLLSGSVRADSRAPVDAGHRRPLVLLAVAGGAVAAASTLVVCLAVGVVGWFLTDAGAHGAPRDGLRAGAVAWLMGHGSGLVVGGVTISAIPLGVSVMCAWAVWRIAHRVGDSVSGHGPDADALADGARDWTVPVAAGLFTAAYVGVAVVVLRAVAGVG